MRRMLLATVVLGLAAGMAQAGIVTSVSYEQTVTVASTTVDVYKITLTADDANNKVGAALIGFGDAPRVPHPDPNEPSVQVTPEHGDDPYQAWAWYGFDLKTVSQADANTYLGSLDPSAVAADTHFLYTNWTPIVINPDELNDKTIGLVGSVNHGLGALYVQASIASGDRQYSMDICHVGVVQGDSVYGKTWSSDDLGDVTIEEFLVPEPATLTLLGLGALCLIRRRR